MNTRLLGALCVIGSVCALLDSFRVIALGLEPYDTIGHIASIVWGVGAIAGLIGMIVLNAVGTNTVTRALACLPILGLGLLVLAHTIVLAGLVSSDSNPLPGIGWLVQLAGMLLVGIFTIAAKSWRGWRRFIPLLTVVVVPVGYGIGGALGILSIGSAIIYAIWVLLGYVLVTTEPAPAFQPSVAA